MNTVNVVNGYVDTTSMQSTATQTHVFCKNLHENENFCKTVLACSNGAQAKFFDK